MLKSKFFELLKLVDCYIVTLVNINFTKNQLPMAFSTGFKTVQLNRQLQTKARMKYRDMLDDMSSTSPLKYNEDFAKKYSPEQLKKMRMQVRKEVRGDIYRKLLYTVGILSLIVYLFYYFVF